MLRWHNWTEPPITNSSAATKPHIGMNVDSVIWYHLFPSWKPNRSVTYARLFWGFFFTIYYLMCCFLFILFFSNKCIYFKSLFFVIYSYFEVLEFLPDDLLVTISQKQGERCDFYFHSVQKKDGDCTQKKVTVFSGGSRRGWGGTQPVSGEKNKSAYAISIAIIIIIIIIYGHHHDADRGSTSRVKS